MKAPVIHRASASKITLDTVMESSGAWLEWIDEAVRLESLLKTKIPWDQLNAQETIFIQKRLGATAPESQFLINSFYVTMVAGFEEFLRSSVRELAAKMSRRNLKFADIDADVRRMNIRESAKLLKRMDSPPDYFTFSETDLCRAVGSCVVGSVRIELNPDAFAEIEGLLKLDGFMARASILGKPISWDYFGNQQAVKDAVKLPKEKARAVGKQLSAELVDLARFRNRIAHTGGYVSDVTLQILQDHRGLLKALADAIDNA